jgi:hypothetical protein
MSDLVERLRDVRKRFESGTPQFTDQLEFVTSEAADTIERLQARVAGLEAQARQLRWLRERTQNVLAGRHGDQLIMHPEEYLRATLALLDAAAEERP